MFIPRVIPVLLLRNSSLVKTVRFRKHRYIGDPINAVKLFNDLGADELIFLDIDASRQKRTISKELVKRIGDEASMPFGVGGGIRTLDDIRELIAAGAEKVILNSIAGENPDFIHKASSEFGSSTIVVSIDTKKDFWGKNCAWTYSGGKKLNTPPVLYAKHLEKMGAGELIIQSVHNDGMMSGYDIPLIREISESVTIPVISLGGAGSFEDFSKAVIIGKASAVAAGSLFVFHGPRKAVLINYPEKNLIINFFKENK